MKTINLTRGNQAIVDESVYEKLATYKWYSHHAMGKIYACRYERCGEKKRKSLILMHREIMLCPDGLCVDHINGDCLDNRKENLRICTHQQNLRNQKKQQNKSSIYKGVSWETFTQRWRSGINVDGRRIDLGRYDDERDAALAYDRAALEHFGSYARPNFPFGENLCR